MNYAWQTPGKASQAWLSRPSSKNLLAKYQGIYKVDRLTRSLADFAKLVELFDAHGVSFVSVIPTMQPVLCRVWSVPPLPLSLWISSLMLGEAPL